jgi:hypothetical protein
MPSAVAEGAREPMATYFFELLALRTKLLPLPAIYDVSGMLARAEIIPRCYPKSRQAHLFLCIAAVRRNPWQTCASRLFMSAFKAEADKRRHDLLYVGTA